MDKKKMTKEELEQIRKEKQKKILSNQVITKPNEKDSDSRRFNG